MYLSDTISFINLKLKKFEAFHYIHKRWEHLAPKISESFSLTMEELGPPKRIN